ncbi:translation initiation factor IF-2, partial [Mammaliicoccus vitulinus]|uniref:translation initiation factor IF-2 n=1 Tax=Mammaliicoccus vitulinus TaxID=71237 RepID=UPI0028D747D7
TQANTNKPNTNKPNTNKPNTNKPNTNKPNNKPNNNQQKNNKNKKQNNKKQNNQQQQPKEVVQETPSLITYEEGITVGELADKINKDASEIIKKLFLLGVVANINQGLDTETVELICADYDIESELEVHVDAMDLENYFDVEDENDESLIERPAVVTIMGHVDHGKTTLLDSIRNTRVTAGEAGGITQHIGAYQIENNNKKITFLDTPGHAAFTTMRARGAQVTDITILVVAADDGVMPQTIEAINHAKAAEVPIIVAVNKVDKPTANPDRVMQELGEHGLYPEDWGGDTIFVQLSAIQGDGIDDLLEMIGLVSEIEELKAKPDRAAVGTVIEAELDKSRGPAASLLVQNGTLEVGDSLVVGNTYGRVRAMVSDLGKRIKSAGPSTPVEITGLHDVPQAGDRFVVFKNEKQARQIGEKRQQDNILKQRQDSKSVSLDNLFEQMKQGEMKDLNIIIKGDVQGSVEALAASLMKIDVEGVNVRIIHTAVGAINASDVTLAAASNGIIIGFNVRPDAGAKRAAEEENVDMRLHRIIYKVIEEIESAMKGLLDPEYEEKVIGQAEVRQTFKVSKVGTIAGSYVTEGKITRDSRVRIIRDGIVIFEGELDTLKRFKDDAKEVATGYECGITIEKFNDIKEGDIFEAFKMVEIERK